MALNLGVDFFIPFHDLDPSQQSQCIFFTLRGSRCKWNCRPQDNVEARKIYQDVMTSSELPDLQSLQDYAKLNCCGPKPKGARHQNRIEDIQLLLPLAKRWLEEIRQRQKANEALSRNPGRRVASERHAGVVSPQLRTRTISSDPCPSRSSKPADDVKSQGSETKTEPKSVASPPPGEKSGELHTTRNENALQGAETEPRYGLRPHRAIKPTENSKADSSSSYQTPLSEFRPHANEPDETVSTKIRAEFDGADFRSGWLYIFSRTSSPGHVKIGYTSRSVQSRLDYWSNHGDTPKLIFSVGGIPNAQRAETLVHYELIKEWRAERSCKECGKSHQEWFEISQERAKLVVASWAKFLKSAKLYRADGVIDSRWLRVVQAMDKAGEAVTAKRMLEHQAAFLAPEKPMDVIKTPKIEEIVVDLSSIPAKIEDNVHQSETKQLLPIAKDLAKDSKYQQHGSVATPEPPLSTAESLPTTLNKKEAEQIEALLSAISELNVKLESNLDNPVDESIATNTSMPLTRVNPVPALSVASA